MNSVWKDEAVIKPIFVILFISDTLFQIFKNKIE